MEWSLKTGFTACVIYIGQIADDPVCLSAASRWIWSDVWAAADMIRTRCQCNKITNQDQTMSDTQPHHWQTDRLTDTRWEIRNKSISDRVPQTDHWSSAGILGNREECSPYDSEEQPGIYQRREAPRSLGREPWEAPHVCTCLGDFPTIKVFTRCRLMLIIYTVKPVFNRYLNYISDWPYMTGVSSS